MKVKNKNQEYGRECLDRLITSSLFMKKTNELVFGEMEELKKTEYKM